MPDPTMRLLIRPSTDDDVSAIAAIYASAVLGGSASFELEPPDEHEIAARRRDVLSKGLPWLCAVDASASLRVVGYAYATAFRPRPAYRFTVEDSVYVDGAYSGAGVGTLLLAELIGQCTRRGARQMIAVIGNAEAASVALHRRLGFRPVGTLSAVGWKHDEWRDVALMQRPLGTADTVSAGD